MPALTVIILTLNEEEFIERCINSALWVDEVLVIDSNSTDRTREIAAALGAKVYEQKWLGWSGQRNKGVELAKNDWVMFMDCDEIMTPELAKSIQEVMSHPMDERDGYYLDRRGDFYGLLLPNVARPAKRKSFIRLFNRKYSAYDMNMKVHEEVIVPGKKIPLDGVLIQWRAYVMDEYMTVFNRYATVEAETLNEKGVRSNGLKILIRPILRFLWCYIAKGSIWLGTRGIVHAVLQATSEYMRYAKLWEMQQAPRVAHPPENVYKAIPSKNLSVQENALAK